MLKLLFLSENSMEHGSNKDAFTSDFPAMVRSLLWIGLAFFYLEFMIPVLSRIVFKIEGLDLGVIFSMQTIGFMVSSPLAGYITDHWSKKKVVLMGALGRGIAYFIIYVAIIIQSYILLAIGTFTIGLMVSFFWVPFNSLLSQKSNKNFRAHAFGRRDFWLGISIMIGSMVGLTYSGLISSTFPESSLLIFVPLPIYGICNIIGGFVFQKKVQESLIVQSQTPRNNFPPSKDSPKSSISVLFGICCLFFVLLLTAINGSLSKPFIIPYLLEVSGVDISRASIAWIPAGILNLILAPRLGQLIDKIKPNIAILITSFLGAFATWALIYWGSTNILTFALILIVDMAIATASNLTVQNYLSRISKSRRGKIFGVSSFFSNLGGVIGPLLGGLAWDNLGKSFPFIFSIIVELSLIPLYWFTVLWTQSYLEEQYSMDSKNVTRNTEA